MKINDAAGYFNRVAADYDATFSESSIWAIAHSVGRSILFEALGDEDGLSIADIGCGTGKWAGYVAERAHRLLLSDVSGEMLREAAGKFQQVPVLQAVEASVDRLDGIPSSAHDLVLCMGDPLSYVVNYAEGVAELARITKPGGLIFVSVDSRLGYLRVLKERFNSDLGKLFEFLDTGNIIGWEGLEIHAFTRTELSELFDRNGCSTVSVHALPSVSAYFLFEGSFKEQIADPAAFARLIEYEHALKGEGAPGPHHLYGLFRKRAAVR